MTTNDTIHREAYVVAHGQSARFRIVKYCVIFLLAAALWAWKGWIAVGSLFGFIVVIGTSLHFLLRWKTKAWMQSWGPYKKMDLPE